MGVEAIDKNSARGRLQEARKHINECRLAATALADNSNTLAGLDLKTEILKDRQARPITEGDVLKFNRPCKRAVDWVRPLLRHFRIELQDFAEACRRDDCILNGLICSCEAFYRDEDCA